MTNVNECRMSKNASLAGASEWLLAAGHSLVAHLKSRSAGVSQSAQRRLLNTCTNWPCFWSLRGI